MEEANSLLAEETPDRDLRGGVVVAGKISRAKLLPVGQQVERCRGGTQLANHIDPVARTGSGTPYRLALRHRAQHHNIGQDASRGLSSISTGQGDLEFVGQLQKTPEEAIHPALRQGPWERERQKHCQRLPSHGGDVAKPAGKAAMSHALRRVPGPFEVDVLQAEIGGDEGFMTARNRYHRAVVPDADSATEPGNASSCGLAANTANQRFLWQGHGAINIQGLNVGASVTLVRQRHG